MTLDEYERVRSQRDRFALVPGHENSAIERVVERDDRYVVVDKLDEAERFRRVGVATMPPYDPTSVCAARMVPR
jgi:hypothetical protein